MYKESGIGLHYSADTRAPNERRRRRRKGRGIENPAFLKFVEHEEGARTSSISPFFFIFAREGPRAAEGIELMLRNRIRGGNVRVGTIAEIHFRLHSIT